MLIKSIKVAVASILTLATVCAADVVMPFAFHARSTASSVPFVSNFTFVVTTTNTSSGSSATNQFMLPLVASGTYSFTVDWGDSSSNVITSYNQPETTHTYSTNGTYTVTFPSGQFSGLAFNNTGDRLKITGISNWGGLSLGNSGSNFYGCTNLNITATNAPNLTGTTSLANTFRGCTLLNADLSAWDTANVTDMTSMFMDAANFANGYLSMCLPNKGNWRPNWNSQINVSPATYSGITLDATASATDTNLRFYSQKTSQIMQVVGYSSKINILTVSDYQNFAKVRFTTTGTLPTNLSVDTDYWLAGRRESNGLIPVYDNPQYRVATSYANAVAGTYITYVNAGTGTHTIIEQDSTDGWVLGAASTLYFNNGYDNAGTMTMPASGKWYTRWVYRELSAANKNVFYVSGTAIYDSSEEAEVETEPVSLPAHITSNCVLVGRIIQRWVGNNTSEGQCSVISRKLGPGSDGIGNWNVAKVTTMNSMFKSAKMFDIQLNWNAAACTDFTSFMEDCKNFNQPINGLQINPLGTLTGISMSGFLLSSRNFNNGQVCYRTTGTAPVTINLVGAGNCQEMFGSLFGFNQNLNALDMSMVTKLNSCFRYDDAFNNGGAIGTSTSPLLWSVGRASTLSYMFSETDSFNQPLSTLLENFAGADLTFSATGGVAMITRVGHGLANGDSIAIINSSDIALLPNGTYTIAGVTTDTFTITAGSGAGSGTAEIGVSCSYMFEKCPVFNQDISKWNVSKVTSMGAMLTVCPAFNNGANTDTNTVTGRSGLDGWDVSNATTMYYMFNGNLVFDRPLANWNVGKVTNMVAVFYGTPFNQDLSTWDVSSVTSMGSMFRNATAFNNGANTNINPATGRAGIDGWDTSACKNMGEMFWIPGGLFNRPIGSWDVSEVTSLGAMFYQHPTFNQDIGGWNTSNCTVMAYMLGATPFNQDIGDWDVSKVTNFERMFYRNLAFNQDLSKWDVSSATKFSGMFECSTVESSPFANGANTNVNPITLRAGINGWNTVSGTSFDNMFYRAIAFNHPLGDWNVSNATTLAAMFYKLPLFNQDLSAWDTRKVTVFAYMFEQATAFKQSLGTWNVEAGANFTQMFYLCNINDTGTTANYDALLVGWAAQNVQNSKSFHAGSSKYSVGTGKPARDHLTLAIGSGGHGWTITDGGVGP